MVFNNLMNTTVFKYLINTIVFINLINTIAKAVAFPVTYNRHRTLNKSLKNLDSMSVPEVSIHEIL